jgi:hypothetical protein
MGGKAMSTETRMANEQSTPMPQRSESGVIVRYETKVFSLWDRKKGRGTVLFLYTDASCGGIFEASYDCRSSRLSECRAAREQQMPAVLRKMLPFSHPRNRVLDAGGCDETPHPIKSQQCLAFIPSNPSCATIGTLINENCGCDRGS